MNLFVWYYGLFLDRNGHGNRNNVLIIRTDLIGDYVLFTPALKYLRNKYRDTSISLLLQDTVSGLAYNNPYIDDIIVFNKKKYRLNLFYRIKLLWEIRKRSFKIAFNAVYSRDIISDEVTLWSCGEEKIGWDTITPNLYLSEKVRNDRIYTHLLSSKNINSDTHELQINIELAKLLGIEIHEIIPRICISEKQKNNANNLLADIDNSKYILIGLITNSNDPLKEWSSKKYAQLANRICKEFTNPIFILFGTNNKKSFEVIDNCNVLDLRGKTKLCDLPAILEKCVLVVGNDSGPIHIANAIGVPSICIVGGGHFNRFIPYPKESGSKNLITPVFKKMDCFKCRWNCIYKSTNSTSFPCIEAISVDDVYNSIVKIINISNIY